MSTQTPVLRSVASSMVLAASIGVVACGSDPAAKTAKPVDSGADATAPDVTAKDVTSPDAAVDTGSEDGDAPAHEAAPDAGADAPDVDAAGDAHMPDAPDAPDPCARTGLGSFHASNLPPGFQLPALTDQVPVTVPQGFDTDTAAFPRGTGSFATVVIASDPDSPRVLHVTDFSLAAGDEFVVTGSRPLIIVASGTVTIAGTIRTVQGNTTNGAGGKASPVGPHNCFTGSGCPTQGLGPGGGGPGAQGIGGGGAGYCGFGGAGSSGGARGVKYGNAEIIPLVAGSSGGSASSGNGPSGPGGGALEIVAGKAIVVEATGVVSMAGGAGYAGATGAGSGGSILLEGPSVTVNGVVAVNGGGGGASASGSVDIGEWGSITSTPAPGGGAGGAKAGSGSAGVVLDGTDGQPATYGTGGGGGAGRIRINTACGTITVGGSATITPARTTACATVGTLADPI